MGLRAACTNCEHALPADARFCSHCGQKTLYAPRTLREIAQSAFGRDFTPDGRLWLTLRALVVPGKLTEDWIQGRQQRYLGPMRLFLLALFLQVLAMQFAVHSAPRVFAHADSLRGPTFVIEVGPGLGEPYDLLNHKYANVLITLHGGWLRSALHPLASRAKASLEQMSEEQFLRSASVRMISMQSHAQVAMLPLLIVSLGLAFAGRGHTIAGHTVFALHVGAFALLLDAFVVLPARWHAGTLREYVTWLLAGGAALWFLLALRRAYPSRPLATVLRGALVIAPLALAWPYVDVLAVLASLM